MSEVGQIAELLDKQADLMLRIAEAVGRLDLRADIAALYSRQQLLRDDVTALANRIEAVQSYGFKTRELLAEHIEVEAS